MSFKPNMCDMRPEREWHANRQRTHTHTHALTQTHTHTWLNTHTLSLHFPMLLFYFHQLFIVPLFLSVHQSVVKIKAPKSISNESDIKQKFTMFDSVEFSFKKRDKCRLKKNASWLLNFKWIFAGFEFDSKLNLNCCHKLWNTQT